MHWGTHVNLEGCNKLRRRIESTLCWLKKIWPNSVVPSPNMGGSVLLLWLQSSASSTHISTYLLLNSMSHLNHMILGGGVSNTDLNCLCCTHQRFLSGTRSKNELIPIHAQRSLYTRKTAISVEVAATWCKQHWNGGAKMGIDMLQMWLGDGCCCCCCCCCCCSLVVLLLLLLLKRKQPYQHFIWGRSNTSISAL